MVNIELLTLNECSNCRLSLDRSHINLLFFSSLLLQSKNSRYAHCCSCAVVVMSMFNFDSIESCMRSYVVRGSCRNCLQNRVLSWLKPDWKSENQLTIQMVWDGGEKDATPMTDRSMNVLNQWKWKERLKNKES